jgi:L-cysteine desulfidase
MEIKNKEKITTLLREEMGPALGVTEPAAIAFATAKAYEAIGGELKVIKVIIDPGVYKNGFSCTIPGSKEMGNELAAILGVLAGDSSLELKVLKNIRSTDIEKAKILRDKKVAIINIKQGATDIYIDATVETDNGIGRAVIEKKHANIVLIEANGMLVYESKCKKNDLDDREFDLKGFKLGDFIDYIETISFDDIKFTLKSVEMNKELAKAGMNGAGMGLGKALNELVQEKRLSDDIVSYSQILTGYAVDARMGGMSKPAMTISGSGDHGIISTMPLVAIAEKENINQEKLAKAIALSYLITIYIKEHSGRLSAFCGCAVAAGTGVSAGIVYLLGGSRKQIGYTINNMASNITGIICDGGNFGCSFKAITAASAATQSALFALKEVHIPNDSGIVGNTPEETMQNMGKIASPGMLNTDKVILEIMLNRHKIK